MPEGELTGAAGELSGAGGARSAGDSRRGATVTVMVIAKEPVPGRVKTRLCPPCTPEQAAALATASLRDTVAGVDAACRPGATGGTVGTEGTSTPDGSGVLGRRVLVLEGSAPAWLPPGWEVRPQATGGLGDRLDAAFAASGHPAIVIGMDTPQVAPADLRAVAACLLRPGVDAVLGPALDGGYWTVGFARRVGGAFDGVPMSTPHTARHQTARLAGMGLRVATVAMMRDIDRWADARAVAREHPGLATAAVVRSVDGTGP